MTPGNSASSAANPGSFAKAAGIVSSNSFLACDSVISSLLSSFAISTPSASDPGVAWAAACAATSLAGRIRAAGKARAKKPLAIKVFARIICYTRGEGRRLFGRVGQAELLAGVGRSGGLGFIGGRGRFADRGFERLDLFAIGVGPVAAVVAGVEVARGAGRRGGGIGRGIGGAPVVGGR